MSNDQSSSRKRKLPPDEHECTAGAGMSLHVAVEVGDPRVLERMLKSEPNIDLNFEVCGITPLHLAVCRGNQDCFQLLLDHGARLDIPDCLGYLPLHHAARRGDAVMLQKLIDMESPINEQSYAGNTALHIAEIERNQECAAMLLYAGANFRIENADHCLPFDSGIRWDIDEEVLTDECALFRLFKIVAVEHRAQHFDVLLRDGADVNVRGYKNQTLLHIVSQFGNEKMLKRILECNLQLDAQDEDGYTPVHLAAQCCKLQNVLILLDAGARYDICDKDHRMMLYHLFIYSPLHKLRNADLTLMESILKRTNDISVVHYMFIDPITRFWVPIWFDLIKVVISTQKSLNVKDNRGRTVMNNIILQSKDYPLECVQLIRLCVEHGAYLDLSDCDQIQDVLILRDTLLRDEDFCTQSIINRFNFETLPLFYERLSMKGVRQYLPKEYLIIMRGRGIWKMVESDVASEVQSSGYCDVSRLVSSSLSVRAVESYIAN